MKTSKKTIALISAVILFIIISVFLCVLLLTKNKNVKLKDPHTIAFYKVDSSKQKCIESALEEILEAKNLSYKLVSFDENVSLEDHLKKNKPSLIFVPAGYAEKTSVNYAEETAGFNSTVLSGTITSAASVASVKENKVSSVPLILDFFEIDYEKTSFGNSRLTKMETWKDIESLCQFKKRNGEFPVAFAGKDSVFVLDLLGAITESFEGKEAYLKAVEIMESYSGSNFNAARLAGELCDNRQSPLFYSVDFLKTWYKKGYINPASFSFEKSDSEAFMKKRQSFITFMSFNDHRTMDQYAVSRFNSMPVPPYSGDKSINYTAFTTFAVPLFENKDLEVIVKDLLSDRYQEIITSVSGAPVSRTARTADNQADDVRFSIASTSEPLAGLGHETSLTEKQLEELRAELVLKIKE